MVFFSGEAERGAFLMEKEGALHVIRGQGHPLISSRRVILES